MSNVNTITFNNIDSKINLYSTISNILNETTNEKLAAFCNDYLNKINNGVSESVLFESFISGASNWNFINSVETELSALAKRIDKYKQEIDLSKIVNIMKDTTSAYLVPLIEEVVVDFMNNKTAGNRAVLKDRLMCFHYDPFVKEMLNVLYYDKSINESLKKNVVNNKITIKKIFSPLLSIKENESAFNVCGQYYTKKGSNINRIPRNEYSSLDEQFVNLCNIVNNNNVILNERDNTIELLAGGKTAIINESGVSVDGEMMDVNMINESYKVSVFTNDGYANFYNTVKVLHENFNNIANIDFVSRISLNENSEISVDLFRLKESIYITTNDDLGRHTFYRNVNPIQASRIINEHMNLNISDLFEDLQPNQKKVVAEIDATKKSYEDAINEFKQKINELESCKESADAADIETIEEAIKVLEAELEQTEKDYKEYQKTSDKFLNGEEGEVDSEDPAFNTKTEDSEDDIEVTDEVDDVEEPITDDSNVNREIPEYDPLFDETPVNGEDKFAPSVVKVSYSTNIKTNTVANSGEVHLMIPSVNSNGDLVDELQRVTFTLDADRNPIINNEYMPVSIYNLIVNAIMNDEMTSIVDLDAVEAPTDANEVIVSDEITEPVEENPIDVAYSADEIVSENPTAEPEEVRDEVEAITEPATEVEVEPETVEESEPLTTESVEDVDVKILPITAEEFKLAAIDIDSLIGFLLRSRIKHVRTGDDVTIYVANSEQSNSLKKYFNVFEDWTTDQFYRFFDELSCYRINESKVVVRYSARMESLLESNDLKYKVSKNGDKIMIMNAVNEGVVITVTDDKTGKTVTINTDELNDNSETEEHEENTQDEVTFDNDNNADTEKENTEEETVDNQNESTEGTAPRKFTLRVKKQKTDESLGLTEYDNAINENQKETPDVCDTVKYKGKSGQVISKLNNGDIIISVNGSTDVVKPSQIRIVADKFEVDEPIKDAEPAKTETSRCGIFVNEQCISPSNCVINVNEYNNASNDDIVNIVVEGVNQPLAKKYIKLLD